MHWVELTLGIFAGLSWGYSFGLRRARKDYQPQIDLACRHYEEAARIITKLRTRLAARKIIEVRALSASSDPTGDKHAT
jgi:hypothetical protein